jgi:hypothetical protein
MLIQVGCGPGLLCDLLWSDPAKDQIGWGPSERGAGWVQLTFWNVLQSLTFPLTRQVRFRARHRLQIPAEVRPRSHCQGSPSCRRWLRVLCKSTTGHAFHCAELLLSGNVQRQWSDYNVDADLSQHI